MHACIHIHARLATPTNGSPMRAAAHTRPWAASVCACAIGRPRIRAEPCKRVPSASTGCGSSQAFESAWAFNANIASWNVLRVTIYTSAFESVGLADCTKRGVYDNWGSTLRTAYLTWSSLSPCTPAPTSTPTPSPTDTPTPAPSSTYARVCMRHIMHAVGSQARMDRQAR